MVTWPARNFTVRSCWPVTHTLILEQTFKSSPVNLRFSLFVKIQPRSLIGNYARISKVNVFSSILSGQKLGLTEQKCLWPVFVSGHFPKIISSPAIMDNSRIQRHTDNKSRLGMTILWFVRNCQPKAWTGFVVSADSWLESGAPNVNFRKISVRKTIWDLEFSEHLL